MTWFYSGNPAASPRDQVRFLIGDTDPDDPLLQDEEIDWLLTQYPNPVAAAAEACEAIASRFARLADKQVGDLQISLSQKAQAYRQRAQDLRSRAAVTMAKPYVGGISKADKAATASDMDRVRPTFWLGMHDFGG